MNPAAIGSRFENHAANPITAAETNVLMAVSKATS